MSNFEPDENRFAFSKQLLAHLHKMDKEASPVSDNYPTGLWWYPGHLDRAVQTRRKNNTEVCWTRRLSELCGVNPKEQYYPGSKRRCDVVVPRSGCAPVWIEVKGAWRSFFDLQVTNSSYFKHLESAARDVQKLESLSAADASRIVMIVIGFDQDYLPIKDADLEPIRRRVRDPRWSELTDAWPITASVRFNTRVWIWSRELD